MEQRANEISPNKLITALRGFDLLPAIVFMPTRRKCDEAASEVAGDRSQPQDAERQTRRREIYDAYLAENPEIRSHKHTKILLNAGVASHHAGHIPAWKLLVEKMMAGGLLNAIFATSTVAAGVDFPARTVVVTNADSRGNDGWRTLRASELQQMTGRAGRRGRDNVGFVVLAPGRFQNPRKIAELLKSPPDAIESRFRATYTSLLNLLDAFKNFEQVRDIAQKSFAFRGTSAKIDRLRREKESESKQLAAKLEGNSLGLTAADLSGIQILSRVQKRLNERPFFSRADMRMRWLRSNVTPGRIVTIGRSGKRFYLVISVHGDSFTAMRDDGQGATYPLTRVVRIYENHHPINNKNIERAFFDVIEGRNVPLAEPRLMPEPDAQADASTLIESVILSFAGDADADRTAAFFTILERSHEHTDRIRRVDRDIEALYEQIWLPFERRARVLDHFGYLDFEEQAVTDSGRWLADVRVDRTLLVGEALRRGIFDELSPPVAAGLMASLVADADRNYGESYLSDELLEVMERFQSIVWEVAGVEMEAGIEPSEELNSSAAAAAEMWAAGLAWTAVVGRTNAEEGDLFRLFSRTAEALAQIAHVRGSKPEAAGVARSAAEAILREPVR